MRLTVERRVPVLDGRPFGLAGAYEILAGTVEFALDPAHPRNQAVVDLPLAPRDAQGEVRFSADFYLIKPVDFARGNGRVYYEVPNRGGKAILRRLQYARSALEPREEADFGDGWLMRQGFTLAWMGWQWDVPERARSAAAARAGGRRRRSPDQRARARGRRARRAPRPGGPRRPRPPRLPRRGPRRARQPALRARSPARRAAARPTRALALRRRRRRWR